MLRILAAFIFFTRLPFWKIAEVPGSCFKHIVSYWPIVGWFTAGISVIVLLLSSLFFPVKIAVVFAIICRLLLTGCLHEDGLSDFFDGFGGGTSPRRILEIMKDSRIGTYGVVGLVCYFMLYYTLLVELPFSLMISVMLVADPFNKGLSGMIINYLPYVRKEEESKSLTIYDRMSKSEYIICASAALLPLLSLPSFLYLGAVFFSLCTFFILIRLMKRRIQGYTGDCCGATFLLCELSFYIGIHVIHHFML